MMPTMASQPGRSKFPPEDRETSNTSNTNNTAADYLSYLLRLRRTQSSEGHVWRASLEEPLTQAVHRFEDLPSLFAFLRDLIGQDAQDGSDAR
jgi:hypothetical protein